MPGGGSGMLQRLAAACVAIAFVVPVALGVVGTVSQGVGLWDPYATAGSGIGHPVGAALGDPRFLPALSLTLFSGLLATALVALCSVIVLISAHGTRVWSWTLSTLAPLLAVPHAALAVGLLFLLAPSGWLSRLISPWLSGWQRPPGGWTVPDADAWTLVIGLVVKEVPFLLLAAAAQLPSLDVDGALRIGRTLGYAPARCWSRLILPRLWPRVRLSFLIILAFNLSVVDMAILLGPGHPPTLAVLLLQFLSDPDTRAAASAGALLLSALVALGCLAVLLLERVVGRIARERRASGRRGVASRPARLAGQGVALSLLGVGLASLVVLPIWTLASRWRFPDAWPSVWTLQNWAERLPRLAEPALNTLGFALATAVLALIAGILWLEAEREGRVPRLDGLWYVPLLVPQIALLFGWQVAAVRWRLDGQWWTVLHAHWVYALPYVVLLLANAVRELDPRWSHAAATLGAGYWRTLWRVRLPLLARPVAQAAAVAASVSVAQYLPTLLLGAGRHATLATELVAGQGGMDRRAISTLALLQALLPLLAFALAIGWPAWRARRLARASRGSPARDEVPA